MKQYNVFKLLPYGTYNFCNSPFTGCVAWIINDDGKISTAIINKNDDFYFHAVKIEYIINTDNNYYNLYYNLIIDRKYKIHNGNIELLPLKWYETRIFKPLYNKILKIPIYILTTIIGALIGATIKTYYNDIIIFLLNLI